MKLLIFILLSQLMKWPLTFINLFSISSVKNNYVLVAVS